MSLRLLEVFLPSDCTHQLLKLLGERSPLEVWTTSLSESQSLVRILLSVKEAETVIDSLESQFTEVEGFRILLLSVEAAVPRTKTLQETRASQSSDSNSDPNWRINRQELYESICGTVTLTSTHVMMVLLSAIIAAIGLLRDNATIITGAMVIAPLLGPNMALSLATTLGDRSLALRAVRIGTIGIAIALSFSWAVGALVTIDPTIPEIAFRTRVRGSDVVLAIASGVAGALSFTAGATSAIVGVMVAVALLPPLVSFGLLLGAGYGQEAIGAILLFLTNLICLNLAGVATFFLQNIRPREWWKADRAEKLSGTAFILWFTLLSSLILGLMLWRNYQF
ncbi:MAG: TIGR00341 family protein [Leptolyngbyaceae cyanobacterium SL_5_9]|nr:TIGR00341 family protein [Leptolyngbyaceae cyanobacterium SL_5_9]